MKKITIFDAQSKEKRTYKGEFSIVEGKICNVAGSLLLSKGNPNDIEVDFSESDPLYDHPVHGFCTQRFNPWTRDVRGFVKIDPRTGEEVGKILPL
jgi:hypothetical protein